MLTLSGIWREKQKIREEQEEEEEEEEETKIEP